MKQYYVRYRLPCSAKEYFTAIDLKNIYTTAIETLYEITVAVVDSHNEYYGFGVTTNDLIVLNINLLN